MSTYGGTPNNDTQGNDTIEGDAGDDTLTGGNGNDTFRFANGFGNDVITDFDLTDSSGDGRSNDRADLSGYPVQGPDGVRPPRWSDLALSADADGNAVLTFPDGETITFVGVAPEEIDTRPEAFAAGVPCFAGGTPILTPADEVPVEALRPGDPVVTRDDGPQPLLWAGGRVLGPTELGMRPELRPIRLAPGRYGNAHPLVLSPQHAVLVDGALIRARHLAAFGAGARVMAGARRVACHHILSPRHGLVRAAGAWAETFYPGPEAMRALTAEQRAAVALILSGRADTPAAALAAAYGPRARPLLPRRDVGAALRRCA
jgi:hypothetical protein